MTDSPLQLPHCELHLASRRIVAGDGLRAVEPRTWALLEHLVRHHHRVVLKQELLEALWPQDNSSGSVLKQAVMKARRAIGDSGDPPLIVSVPRVGYRFMMPPAAGASDATLHHEPPFPATVAVLPFHNASGDARLDWVEFGLMAVVAQALSQNTRLSLRGMYALLTDGERRSLARASAAALQRATGARAVASGRLDRDASGYRLALELVSDKGTLRASVMAGEPAALAGPAIHALNTMLDPAFEGEPAAPRDALAVEALARGLKAVIEQKFHTAIRLFQVALDVEPDYPGLRLELLRAQGAVGDPDGEALAADLLARADAEGDRLLAARVHQAVGRLYLVAGTLPRGAARLALARQLADGLETPDWTAQTLLLEAAAHVDMRDPEAARRCLALVGQLCAASGNRIFPLAAMNINAVMASLAGKPEEAVALSAQVVRRARALHAHRYLIDACNNIADDLAALGRLTEAVPYGEEAMATALSIGDWFKAARIAHTLCLLHRLVGLPLVPAQLLSALPSAEGLASRDDLWAVKGHCAACDGRHGEAVAFFERAVALCEESGNFVEERRTLPWLVESLVRCGRVTDARALLERLSLPPHSHDARLSAHLLHSWAVLLDATGCEAEARALLQQLQESPEGDPLVKRYAAAQVLGTGRLPAP